MAGGYIDLPVTGSNFLLAGDYFVDPSGNDTSGNGSSTAPFLTIQKALDTIGAAANSTAFDAGTSSYYRIQPSPGVYTETLTVPTRAFILLDLSAAKVVGNVTVQFDQSVMGGTLQQAKFVVLGADLRSTYNTSTNPKTGIVGNLTISSITSGSSLVHQTHIINSGVTGNIVMSQGSGGGTFTEQLFLENAIVSGTISTSGTPGTLVLYAANVDTSSSFSIGGISGVVQLNVLRNVRFDGAVVTSGGGSRWFDVDFKAATAHDFTGSSATVVADANSVANFNANVPTKGSIAFTYADTAFALGYTPTTSGNWSPVPTTVGGGLDTLAAAFIAAGTGTVTSVDMTVPSVLSVSGNPVTTSGTLAIAYSGTALPVANGGTASTTALNSNRFVVSSSSKIVEASAVTASRAVASDANGLPVASATTATELGYVNGVTSAIQTQMNLKAPLASPTFSGTITTPLTASRALATGSSSELAVSATTATELGYVNGVTSAIQTQLNLLAPKASPAFTTQVTFSGYHMEPSEQDSGNSGTTKTVDLSAGSVIKSTLTGSVTYTLTNPVTGGTYVFRIIQGASAYTVTWPATVKWPSGTAPVITTTSGRMDLVSLVWDGSAYYGSFLQNYTP